MLTHAQKKFFTDKNKHTDITYPSPQVTKKSPPIPTLQKEGEKKKIDMCLSFSYCGCVNVGVGVEKRGGGRDLLNGTRDVIMKFIEDTSTL